MSDGLREAVTALAERMGAEGHVQVPLRWAAEDLRAVLLANPPQDAGEGLDEARVAAVLAAHEHEYERRVSPSHACSCGKWAGDFDWDGSENDGYNDTYDAWADHVAAIVADQP